MNGLAFSSWLVLAGLVFPQDMSEEKRLEKLRPHFHPQVGEVITVDPFERANLRNKDPLDLRGYIDVTPPGQCFVIRKKSELPDMTVCKPTRLSYSLNEMTLAGTIEWTLFVDDRDTGTALTWPTPYRLAQIMPTGLTLQFGHYAIIETCAVSEVAGERKITLTLMDGVKINIHFPETDTLIDPQPDPEPNLYFNTKRKKGLSIDQSKVAASKKASAGEKEEKAKKKKKKDAQVEEDSEGDEGEAELDEKGNPKSKDSSSGDMRNSALWTRKEEKKQNSKWVINPRDTFEMGSAMISSDAGPGGLQGKCRYRLSGAPEDPQSGFIECIPIDRYSHFLAHLSCVGALPPSKK